MGVRRSHTDDEMEVAQSDFITEYVRPMTRMIQHQWLTYILQLRADYEQLHSTLVQLVLEQQQRYSHCECLVVEQLLCWKHLEAQLELLELLLFCIALIPIKLENVVKDSYDYVPSSIEEVEYS